MNPYESARETELRELREKYRELEYENDDLKKELKRLEDIEKMNEHLLMIHKNRSNALREIRPKKDHSGYVLKKQEMAYDRYLGNCWRIVMETPYSCEMTADEVIEPVTRHMKVLFLEKQNQKLNIKLSCDYTKGFWNCSVLVKSFYKEYKYNFNSEISGWNTL